MSSEPSPARLSLESLLRYGSVSAATVGCANFTLACFLPIYTNEIVWKAHQGRLWYEEFQSTGTVLTCGNYSSRTPLLLLPFRLRDTALYQDLHQPLAIRAIGLTLALAPGSLVWLLLRPSLGKMIPHR